jgi:hypothetical protein
MSHHFDTQLATRDPRLNVADAYLFDAAPDRTVMVMTCSADAALSAPAAFRPAALYEFRLEQIMMHDKISDIHTRCVTLGGERTHVVRAGAVG